MDWALSRDRYWGTPLPVWISEDDPENVAWIGSYAELAERAGDLGDDFDPHRPFIDEVTWRCPETGSVMRRAPEVIDVWFDSGAMPWAQWHYPFENVEMYERHFPADFICEAVDQTRGWFYSLHAISTMLGLGPVFRNVIVNDLILDAAGRKMSKSRGNVVDPWDAVADHGADGVRWYMITVSNPWLPTRFDPDGVKESAARFFDTLQNIYRFFALYANVEEWGPGDEGARVHAPLDRWLLSRLHTLIARVRDELDGYNPTRAYRAVAAFVDGELSNWYVRRARPRFWGNTDPRDADAAFATLHEALRTVALLIAPVTPFISDWLHRALTGRSSHTEPFPEADPARIDQELEGHMDDVRSLSTLARAAREEVRIRVRQPLGRMLAVVPGTAPADDVLALLIDEINVKKVEFAASSEGLVTLSARPAFRALGRRFGKLTQEAAARIRELGEEELGVVRGGGVVRIEVGGGVEEVGSDEMEVVEEARGDGWCGWRGAIRWRSIPLWTRDFGARGSPASWSTASSRLRRDSGLEITDRIRLVVDGTEAVCAAARDHEAAIARETLAVAVGVGVAEGEESAVRKEVVVDGEAAVLGLTRQA